MVKTDIKLSPSKPFVWYQEYHYYGMDPENFHTHPPADNFRAFYHGKCKCTP